MFSGLVQWVRTLLWNVQQRNYRRRINHLQNTQCLFLQHPFLLCIHFDSDCILVSMIWFSLFWSMLFGKFDVLQRWFWLFITWFHRMAQSYKNNFITGAQSMYRNEFCEKSFSSWDFAITGEKSLKNKYEANSSQLKVGSIVTTYFLRGNCTLIQARYSLQKV